MLALMRTVLARPRHLLWLVIAALLLAPTFAQAQTAKTVSFADSALLITTLPRCTTACPDSARLDWAYGGKVLSRTVPPRAVDTMRVARMSVLADAVLTYTAYKPDTKSVAVAAYVAPVVVPPVVPPPAPQPNNSAVYRVPALPATFTPIAPQITRTVRLSQLADLQAAINGAESGDVLVLPDNAVWSGNFVLQAKNAGVTIRSATCSDPGVRAVAGSMARIETPNSEAAIRTNGGANGYRLECLDITHAPTNTAQNYGIVVLGRGDETTVAQQPSDITLDRVYVHGSLTVGTSRCVAFNGARLAVMDSYLAECHGKGFDAQGVGGWAGAGPYLITNNRIEASGQAVFFGGADPRITNQSPSDITITRNYLYKPLSWGNGKWSVKATFELKHGKRVLFEGNVLENHWADAQTGFAILLQTLADNNTSWAWTTVQDITIRNNIIRNATSGINIAARVVYNGGTLPTNPTSRVLVENNLFENVGRDPISSAAGIAVQLLNDLIDVTVTRNTFSLASSAQKVVSFDGKPETRTTITDNIFPASSYQVIGSGFGIGLPTLTQYMPDGLFTNNTVPGLSGVLGNARGSGVNMAALNAVIAGVVR